jgi:DNA-binding HxlR family transcriptional regulator
MTIEDMIKNMNPQMLQNALSRMNSILSPEQIKQVENAIKSTDKGTLNQRLNNLNADDLRRELQSNPQLAKQMANNKELMNKLNGIFGK